MSHPDQLADQLELFHVTTIDEQRHEFATAVAAAARVVVSKSGLSPVMRDLGWQPEETGGSAVPFFPPCDNRPVSPNAGKDPDTVRAADLKIHAEINHLSGIPNDEERAIGNKGRKGQGFADARRQLTADHLKRVLDRADNDPVRSLALIEASKKPDKQ